MYDALFAQLDQIGLATWIDRLRRAIQERFDPANHADLQRWQAAIDRFPSQEPDRIDLNSAAVTAAGDLAPDAKADLRKDLLSLHPWRKGPFDFFGIKIDTEWRSDLKWERVRSHIDVRDKTVLDVGSGNGYYGFRMLGEGAKLVCGLDPFLLYVMQFQAAVRLVGLHNNFVVPVGDEMLSDGLNAFDVVFSMGVLYHRRSPLDHLIDLRKSLHSNGQLVLETLVVDNGADLLFPSERYAKMRNVWFIPSTAMLQTWLDRAGFRDMILVDVTRTTTLEQRRTEWMEFESLEDFLDPDNSQKTIEGYPGPMRATVVARKNSRSISCRPHSCRNFVADVARLR